MTKIIIALMTVLFIYTGINIYMFSPMFLIQPVAHQNQTELLPNHSFEIKFAQPINKEYYQKQIALEPRAPMQAIMNPERTKITITPKTAWRTNTIYKIHIPKGRATNFQPIQKTDFAFKITEHPQVISIIPEKSSEDVIIDTENPITVNFDKPTEGFFVNFVIEPEIEVTYRNNEDKTSFDILPTDALTEGQKYTITVKSKPITAENNKYKQLYVGTFTTLISKPEPQKTWTNTLNERVDQAQQFTQAQIKEDKYIDINLSTQIMTIFEDGNNLGSFLISSGKAGMNTPKGTFQVHNKHPRPWSDQYKLYMPYWMAITSNGKYGIHELPEWPSGYKEGANHLGVPVSHGCVRLGVGSAKNVYEWATVGTPIIIY